jgi:hypothetical protein
VGVRLAMPSHRHRTHDLVVVQGNQ